MSQTISANNPDLKSFIEVSSDHDFPIQNLPFGIFKPQGNQSPRVGVAIGDFVLDLAELTKKGLLPDIDTSQNVFNQSTLNPFISLGQSAWREVRKIVSQLLSADNPTLRDNQNIRKAAIHPINSVEMLLPIEVAGYTDFYSSREHATNLGTMFRSKENPLLENWLHIPVGYDGRASSIVVSGTNFHRPCGQILPKDADAPIFSASKRLDCELELGFIVGKTNEFGQPIAIDDAEEYLFGVVLLNDWSARDIQKWEYQPLGPFLGKNFCTSISPWVVTMDALAPFRLPGPKQDPKPLPYLNGNEQWGLNIDLEILLKTKTLSEPQRISTTNFRHMYWTCAQQLIHHAINGCQMRVGDLLGSGTVSGQEPGTYGSLIELCWGGKNPIELAQGETRCFLEDGDTVTLKGYANGRDYRVGFGEVTGTVLPALKET